MRRITGNPPKEAPRNINIYKRNAPKLPERSFKNLKRWIKFGFPKLNEPGSLMAKSGWVAQRGGDAGGARQQFASWTRLTSDESEADKGAERTRATENSFDTRRKWKQKPALHFLCYILLTSLDQITKNRTDKKGSRFLPTLTECQVHHLTFERCTLWCDSWGWCLWSDLRDIYTLYPDCISVSYLYIQI